MAQVKDMSAASRTVLNGNKRERNYGKDRNAIAATGAVVAPTTLALKVGETGRVVAQVNPADSIQRGTWSTSAGSIVSLAEDTLTNARDVNVKALAVGTVNVIFTSEDGSFTAQCAVTVTAAS